jgi:hypothetical protein
MRVSALVLSLAVLAGCGGGSGVQSGPVTGTYSGTFMIFGAAITLTANLSESSTMNGGSFALSGAAHGDSNGTICDIPTTAVNLTGSVTGSTVAFSFTGTGGGNIAFSGTATDNTFTTISGNLNPSGACSGIARPLTLTRQ